MGLESLIEVQTGDASQLAVEPEAWDAGLCVGAAFVWWTIADAAAALRPREYLEFKRALLGWAIFVGPRL